VLAALCASAAALLYQKPMTPQSPEFALPGDHHHYLSFASGQPDHVAPFCWRLGLPLLARALSAAGLPLWTSFLIPAFLSIAGAGLLIFLVAREAGGSPIRPWLALALFFALPQGAVWALHDFWIPDAMSLLVISAGLLAILRKRDLAFLVVLLAGTVVKESALFLVPLFYGLRARRVWDARVAWRSVLLALPAVAAFLLLRLVLPQDGSYTWAGAAREAWAYHASLSLPQILARLTIGPLGILAPLAVLGAWRERTLALRLLPFLAAVYVQVIFARNIERMVILAVPPLILAALAAFGPGIKDENRATGGA
jgi:hypothetical protein